MMAKRREDRPASMYDFLKEFRQTRVFKVLPKPPKEKPALSEQRKGFI
jgi:hypothetical protein